MSESFNPYRKWLGIPLADQPPNHYRLLGIAPFEDDPDVIAYAADRQMSHVRKFQSGQNGPDAQKLLSELAQARRCLLSSGERSAYDQKLRITLKGGTSAGGAAVAAPQPSKAAPVPAPPLSQPVAGKPVPPQAPVAQASVPQSEPPVATKEVPKAVPVAVAGSPQSNMAVRTRSVSSASRRARRKNSALPMVAAMFALVAFGLVGIVVAVAMNSEYESGDSDGGSAQAPAPPTTRVRQPADDAPTPPERPPTNRVTPKPPKDHSPAPPVTPPKNSGSDTGSGVGSSGEDTSDTTSKNSDPPGPTVDANDPQRAEKFEAAATAAATALGKRDMETAAQQLAAADGLKFSHEEQAIVLEIEELHDYLDQFWQAVDRGIAKLQSGDDVVFGDDIANFVSFEDEKLTLLIRGNRKDRKLREFDATYLVAIAQRGLNTSDADAKLILAAFLAVDARVPSQEQFQHAKTLYDEAVAGGSSSEAVAERLEDVVRPSLPEPGNDNEPAASDPPADVDDAEPDDDLPQLPGGFDPDKGLPQPDGPGPDNIPDAAPVSP